MNGKIIPENNPVKALGDNIAININFDGKEICGKVIQKNSAFARLLDYMSERKTKLLLNTVVVSKFKYCPLKWLFSNRAADIFINRTTRRAMRIICNNDNEEALDALLQKD